MALSTGHGFQRAQVWYREFTYQNGGWRVDRHPRLLADVNGDGKADIVGFGNREVYVALSANSSVAGTDHPTQNLQVIDAYWDVNHGVVTLKAQPRDPDGISFVSFWVYYNGQWHGVGIDGKPDAHGVYEVEWPIGCLPYQNAQFAIHVKDERGYYTIQRTGFKEMFLGASDQCRPLTGSKRSPVYYWGEDNFAIFTAVLNDPEDFNLTNPNIYLSVTYDIAGSDGKGVLFHKKSVKRFVWEFIRYHPSYRSVVGINGTAFDKYKCEPSHISNDSTLWVADDPIVDINGSEYYLVWRPSQGKSDYTWGVEIKRKPEDYKYGKLAIGYSGRGLAIKNGNIQWDNVKEVSENITIMGVSRNHRVVYLVAAKDRGRYSLAQLLKMGVDNAIILDSGGSSQIYGIRGYANIVDIYVPNIIKYCEEQHRRQVVNAVLIGVKP